MDASALDRDVSRRAHAALKVSMLEGALHAVMVGVAESYLGAFAVELGHGPRRLAVLSTLPLFAGACCQLFSPLLCAWLGGRKRVAVAGALGQTASIAGLLLIAATQSSSVWALLLAKLAFWVSGGAMAPAWNAWMASLTLHTDRPRYFGTRSALNHLALLLAFGAAGVALHGAGVHVLQCFVTLFAVACVARLSSAVALTFQVDLEATPRSPSPAGSAAIVPRLRQAVATGHFGVALYLAALAFGTQLAAPFFTPYMLRELALDYRSFAALSALSILAKALTFPCCHGLATRFGLRRVLCWAGFGVAVIPAVWAGAAAHFPALIFAHVVGGAVWAAVEYASFQLLLDNAPPELTAEFFSVSNALTGLAQVGGALSGGLLLGLPGVTYAEIFVLSALLRGLPLLLLFSALRPESFPTWLRVLHMRISSVRPVAGAAQQPILAATELAPRLDDRRTDAPPPS